MQTALARPCPANECFAAKILSFSVCPVFILMSTALKLGTNNDKIFSVNFYKFKIQIYSNVLNNLISSYKTQVVNWKLHSNGVEGGFFFFATSC